MKYSVKVKNASNIINAINGLSDGLSISILYRGEIYKVKAYKDFKDRISYSVWNTFSGMNVSKVGRTSLTLYSYDMMKQRTTYRLPLDQCSLLPE